MWKQVLGKVASRRWTVGHMLYSTEDLRTIRKQAFFSSNYNLFSLSQVTRAWIISLGIRKQALNNCIGIQGVEGISSIGLER